MKKLVLLLSMSVFFMGCSNKLFSLFEKPKTNSVKVQSNNSNKSNNNYNNCNCKNGYMYDCGCGCGCGYYMMYPSDY